MSEKAAQGNAAQENAHKRVLLDAASTHGFVDGPFTQTLTDVRVLGYGYGYEDDVYGSCSCGETRQHSHIRCLWGFPHGCQVEGVPFPCDPCKEAIDG